MKRRILRSPCKPSIPRWKIKRAVDKVLHDHKNSKKERTQRGLGLTSGSNE